MKHCGLVTFDHPFADETRITFREPSDHDPGFPFQDVGHVRLGQSSTGISVDEGG